MAAWHAVGLDVGGTKIAGGRVAFPEGAVLARRTIPTGAGRGGVTVLEDALALAAELIAAGPGPERVAGLGVAVAELVDAAGRVTSGHTILWSDLPVRERFSSLLPAGSEASAIVESDVRAAALGEARFGAGRAFRLFVYVTVGTGISSCLVQGGRPFAGARGNALVLASSPLSVTCPRCRAPADQILEEYASGPALVTRYNEAGSTRAARGEEVLERAVQGDPVAVEVARTAGAALGNSVGLLVNVLDPEAAIVGGGLGLAGGLYWDSFESATREHIWADSTRSLPILTAALGADAGLIGAATAAWERAGSPGFLG
jgi:glucokinase